MEKMLLTPAQRLIVAADFKPEPRDHESIRQKILDLSSGLGSLGPCLKLNSAARAYGHDFFHQLQLLGFDIFADFKYNDIGATLEIDGELLNFLKPRFATVMLSSAHQAMSLLKAKLPDTNVLGVGVLTTFTEEDCQAVYGCDIATTQLRLMEIGMDAGVDGFICAPKEAADVRRRFGEDILIISPGVRFRDVSVASDDQNPDRVMDPEGTILAGADGIVMGRPITAAADPLAAAKSAIAGIEAGLAAL